MTEFFKTVAARHKWNTAFILWSVAWVIYNVAFGLYGWAVLHVLFAAFFVWMSVVEERRYKRHVARMKRIEEASDIEALLRVINERR